MKNAKTLARIALSALIRVLLLPLCLLPIRKNRVLFVSYRGKQYSCSPRAISEALEKMSGGEIELTARFAFTIDTSEAIYAPDEAPGRALL